MPSHLKSHSILARRYAKALFDYCAEHKEIEKVEKEIHLLQQMLSAESGLQRYLSSDLVGSDDKADILSLIKAEGKISDTTMSFVAVVLENHRLDHLTEFCAAFADMVSAHNGMLEAQVISVYPLEKDQMTQLKKCLDKNYNANVRIQQKVDPSIIGGLIVRVGSSMFDDSLKSKINNLAMMMKEGA